MPSNVITPDLSEVQKQTFENTFYMLSQQKENPFMSSEALVYVSNMGKAHNLGRIGRTELVEVNVRNPLKQYADFDVDNRQFSMKRFTKTFQIDAKDDINDLISDPTSYLMKNLEYASRRAVTRQVILGASGAVLTGAPNSSLTSVSAATDGVLTITATGGLDYSDIQSITQNFINNDIDISELQGSLLCVTGKENTELMGISQFINNDFISTQIVNEGIAKRAGMYKVALFAGSDSAITVPNPMLTEGVSTRTCLVLAPRSVAISYKLNSLRIERAADRVDSNDATIDLWIGTMRIEGPKVQLLTTTMV